MSKRRTREERQRILEDQKTRSLSDSDCVREHNISLSQLKRWRSAVEGRKVAPADLVEITPTLIGTKNLTINLGRNALVEIPPSWPVAKIALLIRELGLV